MNQHYIAIFNSSRRVIQADELCRENELSTMVVHTPKQYSSECGMSLKIASDERERFEELMGENQLNYELYQL